MIVASGGGLLFDELLFRSAVPVLDTGGDGLPLCVGFLWPVFATTLLLPWVTSLGRLP